jgi:hypothetical protein
MVNSDHYKARLLEVEKEIGSRLRRETALGRERTGDSSRVAADESVADEGTSEGFLPHRVVLI